MAEQDQIQTPTNEETKPERVDELDIFGGLLLKFVKYFITFYRKLFASNK